MRRFYRYFIGWAAAVSIGSPLYVHGQQDPYQTHYRFNRTHFNPAFTGDVHMPALTLLYHNQWTFFQGPHNEKAPRTLFFAAEFPFKKAFKGVAVNVIQDQQAFEKSIYANISAAYRRSFGFGDLTAGLVVGGIQKAVDGTWIAADPNDPKITGLNGQDFAVDVGLGVLFEKKNWFVALSALRLTSPTFQWGSAVYDYKPHIYLYGGYDHQLNETILLKPRLLFKTDGTRSQMDIGLHADIGTQFWGGLNFRTGDALSFMGGMKVRPDLWAGYAYDLTLTRLIRGGGSHEFLVKYFFKIKIKTREKPDHIIWTPRFL